MNPGIFFWLGLVTSSLLCGCSSLSDKQQSERRTAGAPAIEAAEIVSESKAVLVVAETNRAAMAEVLTAGGTVTHDLPILNAVGAKLKPETIKELIQTPEIVNIVVDSDTSEGEWSERTSSASAVNWLTQEQGSAPQNAWVDSLVNRATHGLTGRGIGIAIIDTGIAKAGNKLGWNPNIIARYDAIADTESGDVVDVTGHGSHLSSLVTGVGEHMKGIAPDAPLIVVKAFDSRSNANFLDVIRAVQWVIANKEHMGIRVVNLSVSASTELPYHIDPLNRALTEAWDSGLVVVVSAGNQGPAPSTVTAPGNNPWLISVGAANFDSIREIVEVAPFSGRGPTASGHIKPNIIAPGARLAGLLPQKAMRPSHEPVELTETGLWITSGASQASVVVAGMVALLLEARPELSNDDIKCLIANSATPVIGKGQAAFSPMAQGRGLINLSDALLSTAIDCPERLDKLSPSVAIEGAYLPGR